MAFSHALITGAWTVLIQYRYPVLPAGLGQVKGEKTFTKLDLLSAYILFMKVMNGRLLSQLHLNNYLVLWFGKCSFSVLSW